MNLDVAFEENEQAIPAEFGETTVLGGSGTDGKDGADGFSPLVSVAEIEGGNQITITDVNGAKTFEVMNGKDGINGKDGQDGKDGAPGAPGAPGVDGKDGVDGKNGTNGKDGTSVSVSSVSESTADGGANVVTFSDGTTLTVKNGSKGSTGEKGDTGEQGIRGEKGDKGDPYTLTEDDRAAIVQSVEGVCVAKNQGAVNVGKILVVGTDGNLTLADMPEGGASGDVVGTLDDSNNILLSGNLSNGKYTLKYENADGTYTDIGELVVGEIEPVKTNFFVIGGDGYLNPGRASSTGADRTDVATCLLSNYIAVQNGDEIYVYGARFSNQNTSMMGLYKSDKTGVGFYVRNNPSQLTNISMSDEVDIFTINYEGAAYMRVCCLIPSDLNDIVINIKRNGEWL